MYLLRQALSRCTSCNAQYPNGKYASIEAALRHAHYNYKISPCLLQEQDLQVKTHAQEKREGEGEKRKRDLEDEDDEDMTSSGSSSAKEESRTYDDTPPQRDKRPCDA